MISMQFTAVFCRVPEGYIGFVEELPGANTQAATLDQARRSLKEAAALVLEANRTMAEESLLKIDVLPEIEFNSVFRTPLKIEKHALRSGPCKSRMDAVGEFFQSFARTTVKQFLKLPQ